MKTEDRTSMNPFTPSGLSENLCPGFFFADATLQRIPDNLFGLLITAAIINSIAWPFTVFLNVLVVLAVKTKRRLQTPSNVLLACLAVTDLMVGLVVQPLYLTITVLLPQGKGFDEFCTISDAFTVCLMTSASTSLYHLALIGGERYFTIKYCFANESLITKTRLMIGSALVWIVNVLSIASPQGRVIILYSAPIVVLLVIVFQVLVYREARRQEQHILAHQVSFEARTKFTKEKKSLKLTATILAAVVVCFGAPLLVMIFLRNIYGEEISSVVKAAVRHTGMLPTILNSVINPIIYTVKNKQFRIAFIEMLLRRNYHEATAYERRLFGPRNNAVQPQTRHRQAEITSHEQNGQGRNQGLREEDPGRDPEVIVHGATFADRNTPGEKNVIRNELNGADEPRQEDEIQELNTGE